jgi:hypothetical protein
MDLNATDSSVGQAPNPNWVNSNFRWLIKKLFKTLALASIAVLATWLTNWLKHNEIEKAASALKARTEYETAFSLMGHISSNKSVIGSEERAVYKGLLGHLGKNGFDKDLTLLMNDYLSRDDQHVFRNAPPEALAKVDAPVSDHKTVDSLVGPNDLSVRLYTQIANESHLEIYKKVKLAFQSTSRLKVQEAELVGDKTPQQSDLRFCSNTQLEVAQAVREQIETVIHPVALRRLPESLCRAVRPNHLELWVSKGATK